LEQSKTARLVSGVASTSSSSEAEPLLSAADEGGLRGAHDLDERLANRRDIEMIGVLTERLASCQDREAASRREAEAALAKLEEQEAVHKRALARIEQLEFEQGYLRAECTVLRAAAQRTFYAGSSSVYGQVADAGDDVQRMRAERQHTDDLIRRLVPRSLRKKVRKLLYGKS
jgi:hypothetical protein